MAHPTLQSSGKARVLNVRSDAPDLRDRFYEPALIPLAPELDNSNPALVRDQGTEGACTGFGLAAVIDQLKRSQDVDAKVSTRMLYTMAQHHDEWPGEDYSGSSCRGAIRGWRNMGVCSEQAWPYKTSAPGKLSIERAKEARNTILGAYYRLRPNLNDYHAALNESGAIFVSAQVHAGWDKPKKLNKDDPYATIPMDPEVQGGHAFAIVGYTKEGFLVQNSWGKNWGTKGFAIWRYEDWHQHVSDGWVFRLAVSTPDVFGITSTASGASHAEGKQSAPKRIEIAGHFAHFDDGALKEKDDYWSTHDDLQLTMDRIRQRALDGTIKHLLIYAHGGLNNPKASATRIRAMKEGFKRNGIYPFHMMYDTGLGEELGDIVRRGFSRSEGLVDKWKDKLQDASDTLIEGIVKLPGTALWEEMKRGAAEPFKSLESDGTLVIKALIAALEGTGVSIHLAGHSTGGILLGHMLNGADLVTNNKFASCSLLAPACTIDFYKENFAPRLPNDPAMGSIECLDLYNLSDELERDDKVSFAYRKSLLYMVSRAFERTRKKPLLGMERYSKKLRTKKLKKIVSNGKGAVTRSETHGGFDNDVQTMNAVLKRITGTKPSAPFTHEELNY